MGRIIENKQGSYGLRCLPIIQACLVHAKHYHYKKKEEGLEIRAEERRGGRAKRRKQKERKREKVRNEQNPMANKMFL